MREGAPRAALPLLEELVSEFPANGRFRLELARALFLVDDHGRARYHFDYALSGELSLSEINAVQEYLTAMDTRKSWSGQARIAIVPQSNPWQRSGQTFVDIGGVLLLPLPPVERATGLEVGLGGTWVPRLAPDLHARFHLMATGQFFEDSDFNRGHLRGEIGLISYGDHGRSFG
ncbi:MAG: tetratricopeptide repeat protein, partial [Rhodobacteraceae bacterium]|nr:tetratricopeptide repeat protein [Paracoccaceae bacterium]